MVQVKERLQECLEKFRAGVLTEHDLHGALDSIDDGTRGEKPGQRLLYLQASNTSVTDGEIEGMSIVDSEGADVI